MNIAKKSKRYKQRSNIYHPTKHSSILYVTRRIICNLSKIQNLRRHAQSHTFFSTISPWLHSNALPYLYIYNQQMLFIQTGTVGGCTIVHYIVQSIKPSKKFIELKRLTGEFDFVDKMVMILTRCIFSYFRNSPYSDVIYSSTPIIPTL
jgi:hypothetical protein